MRQQAGNSNDYVIFVFQMYKNSTNLLVSLFHRFINYLGIIHPSFYVVLRDKFDKNDILHDVLETFLVYLSTDSAHWRNCNLDASMRPSEMAARYGIIYTNWRVCLVTDIIYKLSFI